MDSNSRRQLEVAERDFVDLQEESKKELYNGDYLMVPLVGVPHPTERKIRFIDYIVCVLVVVFMVAAAQLSQILQIHYKFNNPAFIIWFSTTWLIICFPLQIIYHKRCVRSGGSIVEILGGFEVLRKNVKVAPLFTVYWYLANYLFVWGLQYTNVASSLAIEQIATIFVFVLSVIFLKEVATIGKIIAVLVCIAGVIMVAFSDKHNLTGGKNPLRGDFLILGSCCATAAYMVTYKKVVGNVAVSGVNTLLGFIGLCNLLFLWPIFTILHYTNVEPLDDHSSHAWGFLMLNAFLSFNFNYLLNLGMFFTSPLFFRVGQICALPASYVLELTLGQVAFAWLHMTGSLVVVIGFSLFAYFAQRFVRTTNNSRAFLADSAS